jgi:hypothetical protein
MSSAGQAVGGIVGAHRRVLHRRADRRALRRADWHDGRRLHRPPKGADVPGPRLNDLTVQTSTYGAVIPRVYGAVALTGNVIWLEGNKIKETAKKKKSGGKGGGSKSSSRTYTYSATFAVALCHGPIAGVRRIWIGHKLFYDAGSSDTDTIIASNEAATTFELYLGTDDQLPDPRMQADVGVGNAPAYRGLAYLVFNDLALAEYNNSLMGAQVKAEILTMAEVYDYPSTGFDMPASRTWREPVYDGTVFCTVSFGAHFVAVSEDGLSWTEYPIPSAGNTSYQGVVTDGAGTLIVFGVGAVWRSTDHGQTWTSPGTYYAGYTTQIEWNGSYYLAITSSGNFFKSSDGGVTWDAKTPPDGLGSYSKSLAWSGSAWFVIRSTGSDIWKSSTAETGSWSVSLSSPTFSPYVVAASKNGRIMFPGTETVAGVTGVKVCYVSEDGISWTMNSFPNIPLSLFSDGDYFWLTTQSTTYYSEDGIAWSSYAMPLSGYTWVGGAGNTFIVIVRNGLTGVRIAKTLIDYLYPTLSEIVESECLQSGLLSSGDIDVSALTPTVWGYKIGSVGAIRAALEPLQAAWPFDVIQAGYLIKFVLRGGSSVATIAAADLDARASGAAPGVQITTSREMDSQLPRRITLRHLEEAREYDSGEQYAERLNTPAINTRLIDLPIVLTATEAAGKAEVLLYLAWLERHDVSFVLPPTYNLLEPGDSVTLTTHEGAILLRLTAVNYTSDGRIECQAKYASAAIYTPTAVGVAGTVTGTTTITRVGGARAVLMDVPVVTNEQNEPCYLAAMYGDLSGWTGGVLMTSVDGGTTWTEVESFDGPGATVGIATNTISAPSEYGVVDTRSQLEITIQNGELFSITEPEMFARGNMLAYGVDGRWEIIGARTITQISGANYRLGDMIRGRSGTEWAASLHEIGDTVVLLDSSDVALIKVDPAAIGASRLYRAVTYDRDISTATNIEFTYRAINLKPLAGHAGAGLRDATTLDWRISVRRRSRIIDEWRDYVDIDVGESPEAYQFDICEDDTYAVVKRTVNGELVTRGADYTYTAAEQIEDFGVEQNTVSYVAYMMSSVVGRGYPMYRTYTRTFG